MPPHKGTAETPWWEALEQRTLHSGSQTDDNVVASDDEGWEDEHSEEEKAPSQLVFKRVDSTANLPSRRSVPTAGLSEGDQEDMPPGFQATNEVDSMISMGVVDSGGLDDWEDGQAPQSSALHKSERECYMCQETLVIWRKRDWQYFSRRLILVIY